VACDLAIALAKQQRKVLLVDSDTRAPYLHRMFGLPNDVGLVNIITQYTKVKPVVEKIVFVLEEEEEEEVKPSEEEKPLLKQIPAFPTLRFISAGVRSRATQQIDVTQENLSSFLQDMKKHFDYIILDSPPVLKAGDALRLASATDGIIFVIYAHKTNNKEAYWAKQLLQRVNQNILGAVINMAVVGIEAEYYYSYYYRYKYRYYKSK
jgi:Mrp family chromosome partitioning ATPase